MLLGDDARLFENSKLGQSRRSRRRVSRTCGTSVSERGGNQTGGMLSVSRIDNSTRVRDGYISESSCGHARALPTHYERPICRTNMAADARACTRVPPQNLHGKEGVDGSSPSEGLITGLRRAPTP